MRVDHCCVVSLSWGHARQWWTRARFLRSGDFVMGLFSLGHHAAAAAASLWPRLGPCRHARCCTLAWVSPACRRRWLVGISLLLLPLGRKTHHYRQRPAALCEHAIPARSIVRQKHACLAEQGVRNPSLSSAAAPPGWVISASTLGHLPLYCAPTSHSPAMHDHQQPQGWPGVG